MEESFEILKFPVEQESQVFYEILKTLLKGFVAGKIVNEERNDVLLNYKTGKPASRPALREFDKRIEKAELFEFINPSPNRPSAINQWLCLAEETTAKKIVSASKSFKRRENFFAFNNDYMLEFAIQNNLNPRQILNFMKYLGNLMRAYNLKDLSGIALNLKNLQFVARQELEKILFNEPKLSASKRTFR